jgi:hypothetical protein
VSGDTVSNVDMGPALAAHRARREKDKNAIMTMVGGREVHAVKFAPRSWICTSQLHASTRPHKSQHPLNHRHATIHTTSAQPQVMKQASDPHQRLRLGDAPLVVATDPSNGRLLRYVDYTAAAVAKGGGGKGRGGGSVKIDAGLFGERDGVQVRLGCCCGMPDGLRVGRLAGCV